MSIGLSNWRTLWSIVTFLSAAQASQRWSYVESHNGTSRWPALFPACGGARQSPVDVPGSHAKITSKLYPVYLFHSNTLIPSKLKFKIVTTEHILKLVIPPRTFFFSLKNLNQEEYSVYEINFHWGSNDSYGSEHRMKGKPYAMETQVMGFKTSYRTKERAENRYDGLAGLSLLHEACDDVTKQETGIGLMTGLEETIQSIHNDTHTGEMDGFNLANLVAVVDRSQFYRYAGSLTTPPCTESVIWTVFKNTAPILPSQLKTFRDLHDVVGDQVFRMANNYRPVVPLNVDDSPLPRKIYATAKGAHIMCSASHSPLLIAVVLGFVVRHLEF